MKIPNKLGNIGLKSFKMCHLNKAGVTFINKFPCPKNIKDQKNFMKKQLLEYSLEE